MTGRRPSPAFQGDDAVTTPDLAVFVPNGDGRHETAVLLVGTAEEFGLSQRHIRADRARGGFWISDALADIVYDGPEDGEQTDPQTPGSTETGSTTK